MVIKGTALPLDPSDPPLWGRFLATRGSPTPQKFELTQSILNFIFPVMNGQKIVHHFPEVCNHTD